MCYASAYFVILRLDQLSAENSVPTLADVAQEAQVSTATVSRCLNMPDKVSLATREKINNAVSKLGYTPNFNARAMAAKRTYTIGAIIPTMDNAIFARGLQAFQEELHKRGYTLLVASSAFDERTEAEQIRNLVARGADGLLLIGYDRDAEIYDFLDQRNVPAMHAWAYSESDPRPAVGFDNRASMRALVDQVLDLGHKDIAVISAIMHRNDRAAERLAGVRDALAARNMSTNVPTVETPYDVDNGAAAFSELMSQMPQPTAIICGNDVLAVGAIQRADEMGLRVPQDVSITGFDDIELARIVTPPLTTVHVPHAQMGRSAASTLIELIEGQGDGTPVKLDSHVVNRASLASAG